jgi:hypothetical protein
MKQDIKQAIDRLYLIRGTLASINEKELMIDVNDTIVILEEHECTHEVNHVIGNQSIISQSIKIS